MTEINNRIEEARKVIARAKAIAITVKRPFEEVLVEEICQLFPQPLDGKELRKKIAYWFYERECKAEGMSSWHKWVEIPPALQAHYLKSADEVLALLQQPKRELLVEGVSKIAGEEVDPEYRRDWSGWQGRDKSISFKPLDDKELREKVLLTEQEAEIIDIWQSYNELEPFLKAQQDKDFALLQPKIEEAHSKGWFEGNRLNLHRLEITLGIARKKERKRIEALFADDAAFVTFIRSKGNMMGVEECYLIMKSEWQALEGVN